MVSSNIVSTRELACSGAHPSHPAISLDQKSADPTPMDKGENGGSLGDMGFLGMVRIKI